MDIMYNILPDLLFCFILSSLLIAGASVFSGLKKNTLILGSTFATALINSVLILSFVRKVDLESFLALALIIFFLVSLPFAFIAIPVGLGLRFLILRTLNRRK